MKTHSNKFCRIPAELPELYEDPFQLILPDSGGITGII